jgi:hypothetical protein
LAAGSYRLRAVQADSYCDENALAQEWTVPASAGAQSALTASVELSAMRVGVGTRFACSDVCDEKFAYTRRGQVPSIWLTPQLPTSDPRFATHIVRLVAELPEGDRFASWTRLETLRSPAGERDFTDEVPLSFTERRDEYCVALEAFDVVANAHERIGRTCVADDLGELPSAANFTSPSACRLVAPRAEYDAAFCKDNRAECSDGAETAACVEWRTLCKPDVPTDAGQDASEPDASAAADGSTASELDASTAVDASTDTADASTETRDAGATSPPVRLDTGCACSTTAGGNWQAGAVWSVLLLLYLRRPRFREPR